MSSRLKKSFSGRSVLVTGHTGFKGSWLCMWLKSLGAEVTGYALEPPTNPNNFTTSRVQDSLVRNHVADIRDEKKMHQAIVDAAPDIVFHLAAQSVVRESYRIPRETFEVNTIGVASLLDGVRKLKKPCIVVVITSDKCYENVEQVWGYRESDPFGDHDPYGGSKGAAEILIRSYRHSFFPPERYAEHGVKLASARAGNVIGGGDWTESALIVDVMQSLVDDRPVKLRNPGAFRPWQHVLQALSGYLTLAAKLAESDDPEYCSGWNIGPLPGNELPVSKVVDLFLEEWGRGSWVNAGTEGEPREANILRLSIDKALWRLGWKPAWNIEDTLRQTAAWYKAYLQDPTAMHSFCLQQIAEYEEEFESLLNVQDARQA